MEYRLLKTFQCAAECLNYSKAAELLGFSQPTVTTQMQSLEEELGQKLFIHVGKKTYLTQQGIILKNDAAKLFELTDGIEAKFRAMSGEYSILRIAAHESFCNLTLPSVIDRFLRENKKTDVELYSICTNEVTEGIRENRFDIGIISGEVMYSGVQCVTFDSTAVDVIASAELAEKYTLDEIVERYPYIKYRADALQYSLDLNQVLLKSNIIPHRTMSFGSLHAISRAVADSIGYAVISRDNVAEELEKGSIRVITPRYVDVKSMTSAIFLEDNCEREDIKNFTTLLKEEWR